ncbi:hypothetical protein DMA11_16775 [Marinilabiliaceae bacterium JC017]|nr:hypothetical protein DMA11_16775 [Marinilabiliaceae bacterium JC017]
MNCMQSFKVKKSQTNSMISMGFVTVVIGIVMGISIGNYMFIGFGLFYLIIGLLQVDKEIIKLYANYLEIKAAPAARTVLVKYEDVRQIEVKSAKKIFMHCEINGESKRVRLPMTLLTNEDQGEFMESLRAKTQLS